MKKIQLIILSLFSGILAAAGWPAGGWAGTLFIAFVPLLAVEDHIHRNRQNFRKLAVLCYTYPGFLAWNSLTTWWIYNSTGIGAILAIGINSLFMSVVFQAAHWSGRKFKEPWVKYFILIFYWMSFEYLHLNWSLNWPWLNLGNGFGSYYKWVQWYEYTGAFGGTLWILISNILAYTIIIKIIKGRKNTTPDIKFPLIRLISWILLIIVPLMISLIIFNNRTEKGKPVVVAVVQPNVDPYSEQYDLPPVEVVGRIIRLADPVIDSTVRFLVAPESAIQEYIPERDLKESASIKLLQGYIRQHPGLNIVIGASTHYIFSEGEKRTVTARKFTNADIYYDPFNTAILIDTSTVYQLYHKSKLTPGVESLPTLWGWNFLENFAIDLGGTVGSLGTDKIRKVYHTANSARVSPAICYESIFGEFFAGFVANGAEIMFIITNDGWWGNTPGHRQHFAFASLRAIETRRDIVRSANTGISAITDQRGVSRNVTKYRVPAAFKDTVMASDEMTFYVKHGDYPAVFAVLMTGLFMLLSIIHAIRNRRKGKKVSNE